MSKETSDTLGNQKLHNYALDPSLDRESFINALLDGLTEPPGYFPQNVLMNIGGYESIDDVVAKATKPLSVAEFKEAAKTDNVAIIDTRQPQHFAEGFVPKSFNIGLDGMFANWVGVVLRDVKQPILLVTEPGHEEEAAIRLARVGFDNCLGYLDGGVDAWQSAGETLDHIKSISAAELAQVDDPAIVDVRRKSEFDSEHVVDAVNAPLDYWWDQLDKLDKDKTQYVHCRSGYRSMVFASILKAKGFDNLVDVDGGFKSIKDSGQFDLTEFVCPTTML